MDDPARVAGEAGVDPSPEVRRNPHAAAGLAAGLLGALLAASACGPDPASQALAHVYLDDGTERAESPAGEGAEDFHLPPPPFSEGIFPCSDCHEPDLLVPNPKRRELKMAHQEIVLDHAEDQRWCLDCHDAEDRDVLHLANGEPVAFEQSYRLCGQCHGDKLRDWKAGVHGRRSGRWNGAKEYLLCVSCHDAHAPRFAPMEPLPAPKPPRRTP